MSVFVFCTNKHDCDFDYWLSMYYFSFWYDQTKGKRNFNSVHRYFDDLVCKICWFIAFHFHFIKIRKNAPHQIYSFMIGLPLISKRCSVSVWAFYFPLATNWCTFSTLIKVCIGTFSRVNKFTSLVSASRMIHFFLILSRNFCTYYFIETLAWKDLGS